MVTDLTDKLYLRKRKIQDSANLLATETIFLFESVPVYAIHHTIDNSMKRTVSHLLRNWH